MRNTTPLFIHIEPTDFYPNQVGPTKLSRMTSPRKTQNSIIIIFIRVLLTRLTMDVIPPESMMTKYNSNIPTEEEDISLGYISKIHLKYSSKLQYFNTLP